MSSTPFSIFFTIPDIIGEMTPELECIAWNPDDEFFDDED